MHCTPVRKREWSKFSGARTLASASGIRERSIEARAIIQLSGLQNLAAVKALDVLSVVVLGNYARSLMLAGRVGHVHLDRNLRDYSIDAFSARGQSAVDKPLDCHYQSPCRTSGREKTWPPN